MHTRTGRTRARFVGCFYLRCSLGWAIWLLVSRRKALRRQGPQRKPTPSGKAADDSG